MQIWGPERRVRPVQPWSADNQNYDFMVLVKKNPSTIRNCKQQEGTSTPVVWKQCYVCLFVSPSGLWVSLSDPSPACIVVLIVSAILNHWPQSLEWARSVKEPFVSLGVAKENCLRTFERKVTALEAKYILYFSILLHCIVQWVLQVMFPSACRFIVCWFPLSFTTCFGLHDHLQVSKILHIFIFICLRILLRCFFWFAAFFYVVTFSICVLFLCCFFSCFFVSSCLCVCLLVLYK
jgi:hypothetical protein